MNFRDRLLQEADNQGPLRRRALRRAANNKAKAAEMEQQAREQLKLGDKEVDWSTVDASKFAKWLDVILKILALFA